MTCVPGRLAPKELDRSKEKPPGPKCITWWFYRFYVEYLINVSQAMQHVLRAIANIRPFSYGIAIKWEESLVTWLKLMSSSTCVSVSVCLCFFITLSWLILISSSTAVIPDAKPPLVASAVFSQAICWLGQLRPSKWWQWKSGEVVDDNYTITTTMDGWHQPCSLHRKLQWRKSFQISPGTLLGRRGPETLPRSPSPRSPSASPSLSLLTSWGLVEYWHWQLEFKTSCVLPTAINALFCPAAAVAHWWTWTCKSKDTPHTPFTPPCLLCITLASGHKRALALVSQDYNTLMA